MNKKILSLTTTLLLVLLFASCGARRNVEQQTDIYVETIAVVPTMPAPPPPAPTSAPRLSTSINVSDDINGVIINDIRWATRNVRTPGTFAPNPAHSGGFFTFEEAQNACPEGWRLPTYEELQSLVNTDSREITNGRLFGSEDSQIFLQAAGFFNRGVLSNGGLGGYFWGSTSGFSFRNGHFFRSTNSSVTNLNREYRFNVRCVAIE